MLRAIFPATTCGSVRHEVALYEWSRRKAGPRQVSNACPHSPMHRWQRRGVKRGENAQGWNKPEGKPQARGKPDG